MRREFVGRRYAVPGPGGSYSRHAGFLFQTGLEAGAEPLGRVEGGAGASAGYGDRSRWGLLHY